MITLLLCITFGVLIMDVDDIEKIFIVLKYFKDFFDKIRISIIKFLESILAFNYFKKSTHMTYNSNYDDINQYIIKINEMGQKYNGPYEITQVRNFYYSNIVDSDSIRKSQDGGEIKEKYVPFYVTTPIYYVNGSPHLGHVYTNIIADIIARFNRSLGRDVKFLTGTDEHGEKVNKAAYALGIDVHEFIDKVSDKFKESAKLFNITNDDFIRTTEVRHTLYVKKIWNQLVDTGWIYKGEYEGWYSVRDESFYSEAEIIDGKAPTGSTVEWIKEPTYFFKLSQCKNFLLDFYERNPDFIYPNSRINEVIHFIKELKDLSVSRLKKTFAWGIEVPGDPSQVIYVWLDALLNYLSGIINIPSNENEIINSKFWPCDVHVMGKDIMKFHAVYWLGFLHALNLEMPKKIISHGWWLNEGEKMSKSLNNVLDPVEIIKEFDVDSIRYYLLREVSLGHDGNFSKSKLINRINTELGNKLGNLVQRTAIFTHKKMDGVIPNISPDTIYKTDILKKALSIKDEFIDLMLEYKLSHALDLCIKLIDDANCFMEDNAPWKKHDTANITIYALLETIRYIAVMIQPFIPDTSAKIFEMLGLGNIGIKHLNQKGILAQGVQIKTIPILFPKIIEIEKEALA